MAGDVDGLVCQSRKVRDRINANVMADPRLAKMMGAKNTRFDGTCMFCGGFKVAVAN